MGLLCVIKNNFFSMQLPVSACFGCSREVLFCTCSQLYGLRGMLTEKMALNSHQYQMSCMLTKCYLQNAQRSHSRKKHHRKKTVAQPANSEAVNLMTSTYGAASESFAKPKRQQSMGVRKAEQEYSGGGEDADYV